MTLLGWCFLIGSLAAVLGLTVWCFYKVLAGGGGSDEDDRRPSA